MHDQEKTEAVAALFETSRDQFMGLARPVVGHEAEDAVQSAFTGVMKRALDPSFDWSDGQLRPYAWISVRNAAMRLAKKRKRMGIQHLTHGEGDGAQGMDQDPATDPDSDSSPEFNLVRDDRMGWIRRELERLPEIQRQTLWLKHAEGLSSKEIADLLGLSENAVDLQTSRGRAKLQRRLPARGHLAIEGEPEVMFLDLHGDLHRLKVAPRPRPFTDEDGRLTFRMLAPMPGAVPPEHAFALLRVDDGEVVFGGRPAKVRLQQDPKDPASWLGQIDVRRLDGNLPRPGSMLAGIWVFALPKAPSVDLGYLDSPMP